MRAADRLLQRIGPQTTRVVLSCAGDAPRVRRGVLLVHGSLGCLAGLADHVVAELLVAGVESVEIDPACPHDREALTETVARWQRLCGAERVRFWDGDEGRVLVAARPVELGERAASRRAMLGRGPLASVDEVSGQARLRRALRELLGDPRPELGEEPSTASRLQASGCTACGVCVQACPHDALELVSVDVDGQQRTGLVHRPSLCEGGAACVTLCPQRALSQDGWWSLARTLDESAEVLETLGTATCERCRGRHPAGEGALCTPCRRVRERPFGQAMSVQEILAMQGR